VSETTDEVQHQQTVVYVTSCLECICYINNLAIDKRVMLFYRIMNNINFPILTQTLFVPASNQKNSTKEKKKA
jgi:hypothetical protein